MSANLKRKIVRALHRRGIQSDEIRLKKISLDRLISSLAKNIEEKYFFEGPDELNFINFLVDSLFKIIEETPSELSLEVETYVKRLQDELAAYASRELLDLILTDEGGETGSESRIATILFADIRGFTKMSQNLEPEKVVKILNRYLSLMYDMINKNGGVVDKFIGDGVMALFSDPHLPVGESAMNAVYAAIDMQNRFRQFKTVLGAVEEAAAHIGLGVGVNTGPMIIGNIGSGRRKDYTAIGAEVNYAANIMGKATAGEIFVGKETFNFLKESDIKSEKIILSLTHKRLNQDFEVYKILY